MWNKLLEMLGFVWVRQRDEKGKYIPDNKKTKHKNEAWKRVWRPKERSKCFNFVKCHY